MIMTYKLLKSDNKDMLNLPSCQISDVIQQSCSANLPKQEKETIFLQLNLKSVEEPKWDDSEIYNSW